MTQPLTAVLSTALAARLPLLTPSNAIRLFNGFSEGIPGLVVEWYAGTAVIHIHADPPEGLLSQVPSLSDALQANLPGLASILLKVRTSPRMQDRCGRLIYGSYLPDRVREGTTVYALNLTMQQDSSFYLDTRHLRTWLQEHTAGKTVLNTFAYTGALGVAALAGGARHVTQTDRSPRFLALAEQSAALNDLPLSRHTTLTGDFFRVTGQLNGDNRLFDIVILDPPFFSASPDGRVDVQADYVRLVNKVRPLVADGGWLVLVNNGLFVSGVAFMSYLEQVCASGYLSMDSLLIVPEDCVGMPALPGSWLTDPAPFNHPTKIAVLSVKRKDGRLAT